MLNTTYINQKLLVSGGITGSIEGSSSFAESASYLYDPSNATTLVVDLLLGGENGQRGNASYPFQSIASASNAAQTGDTIWIRPGTYTEEFSPYRNDVIWYLEKDTTITTMSFENGNIIVRGEGRIEDFEISQSSAGTITHSIEVDQINLFTFFNDSPSYVQIMDISAKNILEMSFEVSASGGSISCSINSDSFGQANISSMTFNTSTIPALVELQTTDFFGKWIDGVSTNGNSKTIIGVGNSWVSDNIVFLPIYNANTEIYANTILVPSGSPIPTPTVNRSGKVLLSCSKFSGSFNVPSGIELLLPGSPIVTLPPLVSGDLRGSYLLI